MGREKGKVSRKCVEATLQWATKKEEEGKKVILIITDVAQAFANVSKERLANTLREWAQVKG